MALLQGTGAGAGVPDEDKKKKKKAPKVDVAPAVKDPIRLKNEPTYDPNIIRDDGTLQITPHRARQLAGGTDAITRRQAIRSAPATDETIVNELLNRANALDPALVFNAPNLAAELLMSFVPTREVNAISAALAEGSSHVNAGGPPSLQEMREQAALTENATDREEALAFLDRVAALPEAEREIAIATLQQGKIPELPEEGYDWDQGFWGDVTNRGLQVLGGVVGALGKGAQFVLQGLGMPASTAQRTIATAAKGFGYGQRVFEGSIGYALREWGDVLHLGDDTTLEDFRRLQEGGDVPYNLLSDWEQLRTYAPSWGEYTSDPEWDSVSGLVRAAYDESGLDWRENMGTARFLTLGLDIVGPDLVFGFLRNFKNARTLTKIGGGRMTGADVMADVVGQKMAAQLEQAARKASGSIEERAVTLTNRFRNVDPDLAARLVDAADNGGYQAVSRVLERQIDDVPLDIIKRSNAELTRVNKELKKANEAAAESAEPILMRSEAEIGQIGMDDGSFAYRIDSPEFAGDIASRGFDPTVSPTGKTYFSDDPFATYRLSDRVTAQGAGGEFNIYRVKRDAVRMEQPGEWVSDRPISVGDVEVFTADGWKSLGDTSPPRVDAEALLARKAALEETIVSMHRQTPQWAFPKKDVTRILARGEFGGTGRISRVARYLFSENRKFSLSKTVNDFADHEAFYYNLGSPELAVGALEHNIDVLRKTSLLAGVPLKEIKRLAAEMLTVKSRDDFFAWRKSVADAQLRGLSRNGKRAITPEMREAVNFSRRVQSGSDEIGVPLLGPDGKVRPLIEGDNGQLPGLPSHFLGDEVTAGSISQFREMNSWVRSVDQWAARNPWAFKQAAWRIGRLPFSIIGHVSAFMRLARPILLATRQVAFGPGIQIDQAIRIQQFHGIPLPMAWAFLRGKAWFGHVGKAMADVLPPNRAGKPDVTAMGAVSGEMNYRVNTIEMDVPTTHLNPMDGINASLIEDIASTRVDLLHTFNRDPLGKLIAAHGAEGAHRFIVGHNPSWFTDMARQLDEVGMSLEEYLIRVEDSIEQAVGGNQELRRAIATGQLRTTKANYPSSLADDIGAKQFELEQIRATKAENFDDLKYRNELTIREEVVQGDLDRMLREDAQYSGAIDLSQTKAMKQYIRDSWADGSYAMPETVRVKRHLSAEPGRRSYRQWLDDTNRMLYQGLKPLQAMDVTRKSLVRELHSRIKQRLVDNGWSEESADLVARQRAAYLTKDLLYDISARSSFDRAMKDWFWFAPVTREQLTTYLYKLPRQAYWAPGMVIKYRQVSQLLQAVKDLGWVEEQERYNPETEETTKEMTVRLPWVSNFLESYFNNPEAGDLRVETLNPITPAGTSIIPTLSPAGEAVLTGAAVTAPDSLRPFFDFLAEKVTFDKSTDSFGWQHVVPNGFKQALELLGIELPYDGFTRGDIVDAWNQADVQAARWAVYDLQQDGINPPTEADGWDKYEEQVRERMTHYQSGLRVIHFLNGTMLRLPVFTPNLAQAPAGKAYYAAKDAWEDAHPGYEQQEFYDWLNTYLVENPDAFPWTVGGRVKLDVPPEQWNMADYQDQPSLDLDQYVEKVMRNYGYLDYSAGDAAGKAAEEAIEADPEAYKTNTPAVIKARDLAAFATRQAGEVEDARLGLSIGQATLKPEALNALGFPQFEGREELMSDVRRVYAMYDKRYSSDMDDDDKARLANLRDHLLERAAKPYGREGIETIDLIQGTPAERLRKAKYFASPPSHQVIRETQSIVDRAVAGGNSPGGFTEEALQAKARLYSQVERWRKQSPAFDREMSRVELALGHLETSVAVYEYVFFGIPTNMFGYQSRIMEAM